MTPTQLRNSILQSAITGALVPQTESDGTADTLIAQIEDEKRRLIAERNAAKIAAARDAGKSAAEIKKIKLEKYTAPKPVNPEDAPFEIPKSWRWVRLGDIFETSSGGTPTSSNKSYYGGDIPWVRSGELSQKYIYDTEIKITEDGLRNSSAKYFDVDTVCIALYGATVGQVAILKIKATTNQAVCGIFPIKGVEPEYLRYYLISQRQNFLSMAAGGAQPNISQDKVKQTLLPLPPLPEQRRIVAKLEEILPLVKEYGEAQGELETLNAVLPSRLRKSLLQQAVKGLLVSQNPDEGGADALISQIEDEKRRLIAERNAKKIADARAAGKSDAEIKKIKLEKYTAPKPVNQDECPFEIPKSWRWVRIGDVFMHSSGKQLSGANANSKGTFHKYITTSNLYWGRFELDNLKQMKFTDEELERCTATYGDLLVCEGGDIGRSAIWNYDYDICLQNHVHKLRPYFSDYILYIFYVMMYYKGVNMIGGKGIGIQGLSANALKNILLPLPPLAEQRRIVAKLEEMFAEIEKLENQE